MQVFLEGKEEYLSFLLAFDVSSDKEHLEKEKQKFLVVHSGPHNDFSSLPDGTKHGIEKQLCKSGFACKLKCGRME